MGRRLRVVEITLQAGESATSGFCGLSCERRSRAETQAPGPGGAIYKSRIIV